MFKFKVRQLGPPGLPFAKKTIIVCSRISIVHVSNFVMSSLQRCVFGREQVGGRRGERNLNGFPRYVDRDNVTYENQCSISLWVLMID